MNWIVRNRKRVAAVAAAGAVLAVGVLLVVVPAARGRLLGAEGGGTLAASGFIEAEEIDVASELGGRIVRLAVEEGDEVVQGQVLVELDGRLLAAQVEAGRAAVDLALAGLAQARAGARLEQIRQAEAGLDLATAARDGACQAWQDTLAIRANPQDLDAQIALAEAQVAVAEAGVVQATALKDAAVIGFEAYEAGVEALAEMEEELAKIPEPLRPPLPGVPLSFHQVPYAHWKAWIGVESAQAGLEGARAALDDLYATRDDPQELGAQVDAAVAECRAAEAAQRAARARLDGLRAGASEEEVAILEAQVEQARAALDALLVLQEKLVLTAPSGGIVLECNSRAGELAVPGATLLTLGDLDQVTLTVYVPEDRLGQVHVGRRVEVSVDSFPGRVFAGSVVGIAHQAEFTPRNVQTQEERVNMVFAVDVHVPNPDHALKPGLPADALIDLE